MTLVTDLPAYVPKAVAVAFPGILFGKHGHAAIRDTASTRPVPQTTLSTCE